MKKVKNTLGSILKRFKIEGIHLSTECLGVDISYTNYDAEAAWALYVQLLTRACTQPLKANEGTEDAALESIYQLFPICRDILTNYGRCAAAFSKICIVILNQIVRPFTSKWHRLSENGAFESDDKCSEFRKELSELQKFLINYSRLLAEMSGVEDLTCVEPDAFASECAPCKCDSNE